MSQVTSFDVHHASNHGRGHLPSDGPSARYFELQALPPAKCPMLFGILITYGVLTSLFKRCCIRWFGWH